MAKALEIKVGIRKIDAEDFAEYISELPRLARGPATQAAAEYLKDKFRRYPPYKYVTRKSAYPEVGGFFSDKQRRFVMARMRDGTFDPGYPHRTGNTQRAWEVKGKGVNAVLQNAAPAAVHLFGNENQARQPKAVGWQTLDEMTAEHIDGAINAAIAAGEAAIKKA